MAKRKAKNSDIEDAVIIEEVTVTDQPIEETGALDALDDLGDLGAVDVLTDFFMKTPTRKVPEADDFIASDEVPVMGDNGEAVEVPKKEDISEEVPDYRYQHQQQQQQQAPPQGEQYADGGETYTQGENYAGGGGKPAFEFQEKRKHRLQLNSKNYITAYDKLQAILSLGAYQSYCMPGDVLDRFNELELIPPNDRTAAQRREFQLIEKSMAGYTERRNKFMDEMYLDQETKEECRECLTEYMDYANIDVHPLVGVSLLVFLPLLINLAKVYLDRTRYHG